MTKAEIQLIRSLEDKRSREETGLFVAEGEKLVRELLTSDFKVRKVYCTGESAGRGCTLALSENKVMEFEHISPKDMERASRLKTATDCLALVEIPRREFDAASSGERLVLALDGVQNPGNMGTIVRLADWFGIRDILCSGDSADLFNPKVVQATMGSVARVAVHYCDLEEVIPTINRAQEEREGGASFPVYGTFLEGENIYDAPLSTAGVIVLGSEGRGISPGIESLVTSKLFIPPYPANDSGSESLNVAIAAAIVCSEFRRRR